MAHRHHPKQRHNEYFLHDPQIRRDVITADICRYLGNDALVRPGTVQGQSGFIITAYRNLTSEMIADLRAESDRLNAEDERREQQGYPPVSYTSQHDLRQVAGSAMSGFPISSVSPSYPTTASPVYSTVSQPGYPAYTTASQDPRYAGIPATASPGPDYYYTQQNVPYGQQPQQGYYGGQDPYRNAQRAPQSSAEPSHYGLYSTTQAPPQPRGGYEAYSNYEMESSMPSHSRDSSMPAVQHPAPEKRPTTREHRQYGRR